MSLRIFGAVLIVFGCGGFGAMLARNDRLAEQSLRSLCAGLDLMSSELQYRLTPLPDLCRMAGEELGGGVAVGVLMLSPARNSIRQSVACVEELTEYGYIRRHYSGGKKVKITSRPYHYLSSDGFHIYVGKNNYQNEEVTFKIANGNDWWFHAKGIPGSHVVVRTEGKELPDRTFEEAAALAAWYSKGRDNDKVEIDYIQRKHVKKAAGGAPGFVIYHTNYSLMAEPRLVLQEVTG